MLAIAVAMPVRASVCGCCDSGPAESSLAATSTGEPTETTAHDCCSGADDRPTDRGPNDRDPNPTDPDKAPPDKAPCDGCDCPICPGAFHAPAFKPGVDRGFAFAPRSPAGLLNPTDERAAVSAHTRRLKRPPRRDTIHA